MLRIKHYTGATDGHRAIEIDYFPNEDRMEFIHKLLQSYKERDDLETSIEWISKYFVELDELKDVPFGIRSMIRRRPNGHMAIPAIRIRRETQSESYDVEWEDLIELARPQSERALVDFLDEYLSRGLLE
jgi:hypothetical protein